MALCVALCSCGFSLRGTDALPASLAQTYVQAENKSAPLVREFERQLKIAGGGTTRDSSIATTLLRIIDDDSGERVLSLGRTGGPEELEVYHIVTFELMRDGTRVYGPETLTLRRDFTFDINDVLGKRRESDTLRKALRRNMVALMLRRLSLSPEVS